MIISGCPDDGIINPDHFKQRLAGYLADAGLEPSEQYMAVFEFLDGNRTHPTVDEIYYRLNRDHPELSRSRIYTILNLLARAGLIKAIDLGNNQLFYDGNTIRHPHFICTECGAVLDAELPSGIGSLARLPEGAVLDEIMVNYWGVCGNCRSDR